MARFPSTSRRQDRMQPINRIVASLQGPQGLRAGVVAAGPGLVTLAAVVLIAGQLAALLWRALSANGDDAGIAPAIELPEAPRVDLAAVVNAHLFGIANVTDSGALTTAANLVLAGTLAGLVPENGWAIIGATAQQARVYATGATLPGGARLVAVFPNRVVLERGGVREQLMLPRLSGGAGAGPSAAAYAPNGAQQDRSLVDSVSELVSQNPNAANELLRPQPVFAGGQLRGYRVYPGRNRAQFARIGLKPGDLVTAVNNVALDDPNRGLEILRGVGQGTAVTLSIDRNGQQQTLTVDPASVIQELQVPVQPDDSQESTQ